MVDDNGKKKALEPYIFEVEEISDTSYGLVPGMVRHVSLSKRAGRFLRRRGVPASKLVARHSLSWSRHFLRGMRLAIRGWWRWLQVVEHREDNRAHSKISSGKGELVNKRRLNRVGGSLGAVLVAYIVTRLPFVPFWVWILVGVAVVLSTWQAGRPKVTTDGSVNDGGELLPVFPLSKVHTAEQAQECIRRALLSAKVPVKVLSAEKKSWGWEVLAQIMGGYNTQPGDVIRKIEALEVDLDLRQNGLLVQPHTDRRSWLTLRCIQTDPWAKQPTITAYTPGSRSLSDRVPLATRLDGVEVGTTFQATHSIILAASGGGKSILIRSIVDALGACDDVILWDLDPSGVGQSAQRALFDVRALSMEDCQIALAKAVAIAEARTRLLSELGMGDEWQPSAEFPALVVILDEYPRLARESKDLSVSLIRIARKAGVSIIFASQSGKKDALGDSIAGEVAFKAGGPGLAAFQSRLLFGENCIAEGWNPGAFKPRRAGRNNDAGTFFFEGLIEGDEPIPSKVFFISNSEAESRAARYLQNVRPTWDADTLEKAHVSENALKFVTDHDAALEAQHHTHVEEEAELPVILQQIESYLGPDLSEDIRWAVPSDELAEQLGISTKRLGSQLSPYGLKSSLLDFGSGGARNQRRGYRVSEIISVIVSKRNRHGDV